MKNLRQKANELRIKTLDLALEGIEIMKSGKIGRCIVNMNDKDKNGPE